MMCGKGLYRNKLSVRFHLLLLVLLFVLNSQNVRSASYEDITPQEAKRRIDLDPNIFILDVRSPKEFRDGYIPNATNIDVNFINSFAYKLPEDNNTGIIVYCDNGVRSEIGAQKVVNLGYSNVSNMLKGFLKWVKLGYPYVIGTGTSQTTTTMNIGFVCFICFSVIVLVLMRVRIAIRRKI
ncbi:MAG: rhodanese-like domain-containing protein [Asgard group archaeon]|nr:rhodanese-like domain-containing protein [Asgard group archaeon]